MSRADWDFESEQVPCFKKLGLPNGLRYPQVGCAATIAISNA